MVKLDLIDIHVAVDRFRKQLQLPEIPLADLIEAEASLQYYSRELTSLARKAGLLKIDAKR